MEEKDKLRKGMMFFDPQMIYDRLPVNHEVIVTLNKMSGVITVYSPEPVMLSDHGRRLLDDQLIGAIVIHGFEQVAYVVKIKPAERQIVRSEMIGRPGDLSAAPTMM
jgi:hypothetical protein